MKISTLINAVAAALRVQAEPAGGIVETTAGPEDTYALLSEGPLRWRILLHWGGDDPAEKTEACVTTRIQVTIQQPKGMHRTPGFDVTNPVGDRAAFYDRVDQVRTWCRGIVLYENEACTTPHRHADCRGLSAGEARPLVLQGQDGNLLTETRQAELTMTLFHSLPAPVELPAHAALDPEDESSASS